MRGRLGSMQQLAIVLGIFVALLSVATSLLPVISIVTVARPPSLVATVKVSVTFWPASSELSASLAV